MSEREEYLKRQRKLNEEHCRKRNAEIQPEHQGYVRTTGSRRQSKLYVREDGTIVQEEI